MKFISSIKYLLIGFITIGANLFKRSVTLRYPENKKEHTKLRGKLEFSYNDDGTSKCVACGMCQKVCPAFGTINIIKSIDDSGKQNLKELSIDLEQCIFCGNCVESCPTKSIIMSKEYELASSDNNFKIYMRSKNGTIK